jgi:hypothetical protein
MPKSSNGQFGNSSFPKIGLFTKINFNMQYLKYILIIFSIHTIFSCCRKTGGQLISPASLNIINAIPSSQPVIAVLGTEQAIQYFASAPTVSYGSAQLYSPQSGKNTLYIVQATDTTEINPKTEMFNGVLKLAPGGIYSFFLAGDTTAVDTLFVQDNIPYYGSDSSAGVRFVNLSPGSLPMTVTIEGNPITQTEFSGLAYKTVSTFKTYLANSSVPNSSYMFVVRDQATGDSLTSFSWNYTTFKNNTLVLSGSEAAGASIPLQVFQYNNY